MTPNKVSVQIFIVVPRYLISALQICLMFVPSMIDFQILDLIVHSKPHQYYSSNMLYLILFKQKRWA